MTHTLISLGPRKTHILLPQRPVVNFYSMISELCRSEMLVKINMMPAAFDAIVTLVSKKNYS